MVLVPKVIYRVNEIPIKIPTLYFTKLQKQPEVHMKSESTQSGRHRSTEFQAILQRHSYKNNTALNRESRRPGDSDTALHTHSRLIFDKWPETSTEERQLLEQTELGRVDIHMQTTENKSLSPCTQMKSKCVKHIDIKAETMKLTDDTGELQSHWQRLPERGSKDTGVNPNSQ